MHTKILSKEAKKEIKDISEGKKTVIFVFPKAFTYVCPSELMSIQNRSPEFKSRNANIVTVSTDEEDVLKRWLETDVNNGGIKGFEYEMISDKDGSLSKMLGAYDHREGMSTRTTIITDEEGNIKHYSWNDFSLGRNLDEVVRILDMIDASKSGRVCPAGWTKGQEMMKPTEKGVSKYMSNYADRL